MLTAFYMFRLISLTFYGKERFDQHHVHPHESPALMTYVDDSAFLSVIGGYIGIPKHSPVNMEIYLRVGWNRFTLRHGKA